jgi:hypothetical protein
MPAKHGYAILIFLSLFLVPKDAYAIFDLSVSPRNGGQDIRFEASSSGKLLRNEEATVAVTTDREKQYLITQTVYQPLTNEFGDMIPQGAFFTFSPSSPLGSLRVDTETPVTMGQFPIYTSNAAGDSDSFILVFNVRVPENQPGGVYRTRVTFMASSTDGSAGVSPSTVNVDVTVEIRSNFKISVQSAKGNQSIDLGRITKDRKTASETLSVAVQSNIGQSYRIVQILEDPLTSQSGETFEGQLLSFIASGGEKGTLLGRSGSLSVSESQVNLYVSNSTGDGDAFKIQITASPGDTQAAGIYSARLILRVESDSPMAQPQVFNVPIRLEIEPIFYLDAVMDEPSNIHFGTFQSGVEKQEKKVLITVHSNLGEPYQVSQILSRKLTNDEGATLPLENFQFFGAEAQTGSLAAMSQMPVKEGENAVFTSDSKGTPEKFILNYTLTVPKGSKAGSYRSDLRYSVTTL